MEPQRTIELEDAWHHNSDERAYEGESNYTFEQPGKADPIIQKEREQYSEVVTADENGEWPPEDEDWPALPLHPKQRADNNGDVTDRPSTEGQRTALPIPAEGNGEQWQKRFIKVYQTDGRVTDGNNEPWKVMRRG
jgi:hypothetical protein